MNEGNHPWRNVDGADVIRVYRPDLLTISGQHELRDCAMVTVDMLLRYLEGIDEQEIVLPSYDEIHQEFRGSHVARSTNVRKYVSGETIVDFFQRKVQNVVGRSLRQATGENFDDLIRMISKSRLPLLVSYMTDVAHPAWAIPANALLTLPNLLSAGHVGKWITGGESYVLNDYLHSGVALAVARVEGARYVLLADPWSGFMHKEARGLVWIEEARFCEAWLGYDQRGVRLPWVDSYYEQSVEVEFDRLGGPGGMLVPS